MIVPVDLSKTKYLILNIYTNLSNSYLSYLIESPSPPPSPPHFQYNFSDVNKTIFTPAFRYYPNQGFSLQFLYFSHKMSWWPSFSLLPSQLENEIRRFGGGKKFKWKKNSFQSDISLYNCILMDFFVLGKVSFLKVGSILDLMEKRKYYQKIKEREPFWLQSIMRYLTKKSNWKRNSFSP